MKCKVCGKKLRFKHNTRYLVPAPKQLLNFTNTANEYYECFDCIYCGCQNNVNKRLIPPDPSTKLLTKKYEESTDEKEN